MNGKEKARLIGFAKEMAEKAYAVYSNFHVGAAVLDKNGEIYTGCNVENVSYGLTCCAERIALFKAVSEGAGEIVGIAVFSPDLADGPLSPCGACRQVMTELAPKATVLMVDKQGDYVEKTVAELLPFGFQF